MKKISNIVLFLLFSLTLFLVACEESSIEKSEGKSSDTATEETDSKDGESTEEKKSADKETESLKVGESVKFNDVKITLNEVRIEPGGEFDTPENDKFIVANLTAENNSDEEIVISSMMNVELYDDEGYSYSTTILVDGIKGQFDGSVPAGKKLRGEIPFDVPDSETYELHYSDPFKSGKAIWIIESNELGE